MLSTVNYYRSNFHWYYFSNNYVYEGGKGESKCNYDDDILLRRKKCITFSNVYVVLL